MFHNMYSQLINLVAKTTYISIIYKITVMLFFLIFKSKIMDKKQKVLNSYGRVHTSNSENEVYMRS